MQASFSSEAQRSKNEYAYKVLARKYRPKTFADMVGQDVIVKTFANAMKQGRVAHAFILTGIRGVGKTTTARIIAKSLNCLVNNAPTISPCGKCNQCISVMQDRNQDVLEIDAASHTGVDSIRSNIIENTKYKPIAARYKVFIIDEVHMLSKSAFNALLKTLEEPPGHIKFIFATTEIRKIPITIISRCQRFDLKRVDTDVMIEYFSDIADKENIKIEKQALRLIAKASEGSVRDGLSLLDQAIASTDTKIDEQDIILMLGLTDISQIHNIILSIAQGDVESTFFIVNDLYQKGAEPILIAQEMLEVIHNITKTKLTGNKSQYSLIQKLSDQLSISCLSRMWQMVLKGIDEIKISHYGIYALEMLIVRIIYISSMPDLDTMLKKKVISNNEVCTNSVNNTVLQINSYDDIAKLCLDNAELLLYHHVVNDIKFISLNGTNIEITVSDRVDRSIILQLQDFLTKKQQEKWSITIVKDIQYDKHVTIAENKKSQKQDMINKLKENDLVKEILKNFTGSKIADISSFVD